MSSRKKQEPCAAVQYGTGQVSRKWRRPSRGIAPIVTMLGLFASSAAAQGSAEYALARRITPGMSRSELLGIVDFQSLLDEQLDYTNPALPDAEAGVVQNWELATWPPNLIQAELDDPNTNYTEASCNAHMRRARIHRWINSKKSFYEVMTWFWFNHFNVDQNEKATRWGYLLTADYDQQVCRRAPFGRFRRMVKYSTGWFESGPGVTGGPTAMLAYLDNYLSVCDPTAGIDPNENFSREFLELHTLGTCPQEFTETHVKDLARIFSGWSTRITDPTDRNYFRFQFTDPFHCYSSSSYPWFGTIIPSQPGNGIQEGRRAINAVINYRDPAGEHVCANFIAKKLVSALLTDAPDSKATNVQLAVINQAREDAAMAFATHGEIEDMVRVILTKSNIEAVLDSGNPLYKYMSPLKFITSVVRATEANVTPAGIATLDGILKDDLAQAPFEFAPPIGYSEAISVWAGNQPKRWSFIYAFFERVGTTYGTLNGITVDVDQLYLSAFPGGFDPAMAGQQANEILTAGNLSQDEMDEITEFAMNSTDPVDDIKWKVLALACLAPSFNLY